MYSHSKVNGKTAPENIRRCFLLAEDLAVLRIHEGLS